MCKQSINQLDYVTFVAEKHARITSLLLRFVIVVRHKLGTFLIWDFKQLGLMIHFEPYGHDRKMTSTKCEETAP